MRESYRGQCNLHLYFAEQYLKEARERDDSSWGGHYHRACQDSILWQLLLAYRAHMADMLDQQPRFAQPIPQGHFTARSFPAADLPPEINELADREGEEGWLKSLVTHDFIVHPQAVAAPSDGLIASQGGVDFSDFSGCETILTELSSLIDRHRATLMEF